MLIVALLTPISVLSSNPAGVVTSTQTSTRTVGYTVTNTSISALTTIVNVTESSARTVFTRNTITISEDPCSYGEWGSFHANRTETLSVSFVSSEPLDVYLVTFEQFIDLMGVSSCVPAGALFFMNNVTSYELNMEIPYSGDFILLFVNHSLKPLTLILPNFELSTVTAVHPGVVTFYSTSYPLLTANTTQLVTGTFTAQQPEMNEYSPIIIMAIILGGLALAGAAGYFTLKRKRTPA